MGGGEVCESLDAVEGGRWRGEEGGSHDCAEGVSCGEVERGGGDLVWKIVAVTFVCFI